MGQVVILFGGQSPEHEISLLSAKNIIDGLSDLPLALIGITKEGQWRRFSRDNFLKLTNDGSSAELLESDEIVSIQPGSKEPFKVRAKGEEETRSLGAIDCVFPVLHGENGEDGTIQGILQTLGLPFIGCGVLASSACMDKDICKRLLENAGIKTAPSICLRREEPSSHSFEQVTSELGLPLFLKPACLGSSIGISRAEDMESYYAALSKAFRYDQKVLVESEIKGREIECAVLGNLQPIASLPGEVIVEEFYSYEEKYSKQSSAKISIPAELAPDIIRDIQIMAIRAYRALECHGLARVDFFVQEDESLLINEINTLPGFTNISMYPKMWEASGKPYRELLLELIELAKDAHESKPGEYAK